jgi:hypothetical protein
MIKMHLLYTIAWLGTAGAAMALDCPAPRAAEDAATAAAIDAILPDDTDLAAPDALESAVFNLRAAGISDDLILDNLLAVQCATIDAQPHVSDADKAAQLEDFSRSADLAVYSDVD